MTHLERDNHMHFKTWCDEKYYEIKLLNTYSQALSFAQRNFDTDLAVNSYFKKNS